MKHTYISLGGGCDVAMNMVDVGVRYNSYPFDWLWNLDTGLKSVTKIIRDDFKDVTCISPYAYVEHYRFPEKAIVYSSFPSIVHLHSDPLSTPTEHKQLCRQITRFKLN